MRRKQGNIPDVRQIYMVEGCTGAAGLWPPGTSPSPSVLGGGVSSFVVTSAAGVASVMALEVIFWRRGDDRLFCTLIASRPSHLR